MLTLTNCQRSLLIVAILIGLALSLALALTDTAGAASLALATPDSPPPTAITLASFAAMNAGNRGGCAEGNKIRGLACTVAGWPLRISR